MPRVKSGVTTRQRKKKIFRISKGYYSNKNNRWRMAIQAVERSLRFATIHRKDKKGDFRKIWIIRINAAARLEGLTYSRMISGLKKAGVAVDRKILAYLAINDAPAFHELAEKAKSALPVPASAA